MTTLRTWISRWGATDGEVDCTLPGDELFPDADSVVTRAITVHAPASRVWPWLQQIDQQRGGFYSYRFLENLVGCKMPNVRHLVPAWAERRVGEDVWMTPPERFGGEGRMVVARVDHMRALVLMSPDIWAGEPPTSRVSGTWTLALRRVDDHTCRLVARSRYAKPELAFDVVHFVMERKMMRTIAALAEATPARAHESARRHPTMQQAA